MSGVYRGGTKNRTATLPGALTAGAPCFVQCRRVVKRKNLACCVELCWRGEEAIGYFGLILGVAVISNCQLLIFKKWEVHQKQSMLHPNLFCFVELHWTQAGSSSFLWAKVIQPAAVVL